MDKKTEAYFCVQTGRAIVVSDDKMFLLEVKDGVIDGPHPPPEEFDFGRWFSLIDSKIIEFPVGEYPFTELQKHMLHKWGVQHLTDWFLRSFNTTYSEHLRRRAVTEFERMYKRISPETREEFQRSMDPLPMPRVLDPSQSLFAPGSFGATVLAKMVTKS